MSARVNSKRLGLVAGVVLLAGLFGWLLYGGLDKNIVYFLTPQELLAREPKVFDAPLRLGGQVQPGSVVWTAESNQLRFRLTDGVGTVEVHSRGAPPQMFRDGMGVVVEGRYRRSGIFESTNLMVKHSNEYRAPPAGEQPSEMYESLIREKKS